MRVKRAYMSFGGGVQSTAIAMLAINKDARLLKATGGVLPELYIFADTGDEPEAVYAHVSMMRARIEASGAKFAVVQTALGNLGDHVIHQTTNGHYAGVMLPFFVSKDGGMGPTRRKCTSHFKIKPLTAYARAYFGVYKSKPHTGGIVQMWLGISADERQREKTGSVYKEPWAEYSNPLIAMNWHRADCINYLNGLGIQAKRSACVYCPFHSMAEWREIAKVPADWKRAIEVDEALEIGATKRAFGFDNPLWLNRQAVRLRDLDLTEPDDPQQKLWDNECAGVCGV
jgi:hypothetical protein